MYGFKNAKSAALQAPEENCGSGRANGNSVAGDVGAVAMN